MSAGHITILANPDPWPMTLTGLSSYGLDPYTCKEDQGRRSVGSEYRMETNGQTDYITLPANVASKHGIVRGVDSYQSRNVREWRKPRKCREKIVKENCLLVTSRLGLCQCFVDCYGPHITCFFPILFFSESLWTEYFNRICTICTNCTLTLLAEHHKECPVCKSWVMMCWCGYQSRAMCRMFAYGPSDVTAIPKPHHLASFKSRLVLPFWYWLA